MQVILAKTAGFCPGVKRAVDLAYEQIGKGQVYTYGPIIHNEEVVEDLRSKGVSVADSLADIPEGKDTIVVIRSHGISRKNYENIKRLGVQIVDATCPFSANSLYRLRARSSTDAVKYILISAFGKIFVPISLPSMITSFCAAIRR